MGRMVLPKLPKGRAFCPSTIRTRRHQQSYRQAKGARGSPDKAQTLAAQCLRQTLGPKVRLPSTAWSTCCPTGPRPTHTDHTHDCSLGPLRMRARSVPAALLLRASVVVPVFRCIRTDYYCTYDTMPLGIECSVLWLSRKRPLAADTGLHNERWTLLGVFCAHLGMCGGGMWAGGLTSPWHRLQSVLTEHREGERGRARGGVCR